MESTSQQIASSFVYKLTDADLTSICQLSGIQFQEHMRHNPLNQTTRGPMDSVRVKNGLIGEIGVCAIIQQLFPDKYVSLRPHNEFTGKEVSDVSIDVPLPDEFNMDPRLALIEVKTWRDSEWEELGGCIEPHSWKGYDIKKCPIVWAVIPNVPKHVVADQCQIIGWNLASDFPNKIVITKGVKNYQIPANQIRPPSTLSNYIKTYTKNIEKQAAKEHKAKNVYLKHK